MTLYLLPNLLGTIPNHQLFLPKSVDLVMETLDGLIAESEKEGRRYLSRFKTKKPPLQIPIALLNEHTSLKEIDFLLEPISSGEIWGVVSDAGLPCLADPGALLVRRAYEKKLTVRCFSGPSSITHALVLSGLSAQRFYFQGYISRFPDERKKQLLLWEKTKQTTHIFIEAPYRNVMTFKSCLEILNEKTSLCVACQLTLPEEWIKTQTIDRWKKENLEEIAARLTKKPCIFLFRKL